MLVPSLDSTLPLSPLVSRHRSAAFWSAARRGSCVLAPSLDSRLPSVASRLEGPLRRRLVNGAASQLRAVNGAASQLRACAVSRLEASLRRPSSRAASLRRFLVSGATRHFALTPSRLNGKSILVVADAFDPVPHRRCSGSRRCVSTAHGASRKRSLDSMTRASLSSPTRSVPFRTAAASGRGAALVLRVARRADAVFSQ